MDFNAMAQLIEVVDPETEKNANIFSALGRFLGRGADEATQAIRPATTLLDRPRVIPTSFIDEAALARSPTQTAITRAPRVADPTTVLDTVDRARGVQQAQRSLLNRGVNDLMDRQLQLINQRSALPPGDPRRAALMAQIQEVGRQVQLMQGEADSHNLVRAIPSRAMQQGANDFAARRARLTPGSDPDFMPTEAPLQTQGVGPVTQGLTQSPYQSARQWVRQNPVPVGVGAGVGATGIGAGGLYAYNQKRSFDTSPMASMWAQAYGQDGLVRNQAPGYSGVVPKQNMQTGPSLSPTPRTPSPSQASSQTVMGGKKAPDSGATTVTPSPDAGQTKEAIIGAIGSGLRGLGLAFRAGRGAFQAGRGLSMLPRIGRAAQIGRRAFQANQAATRAAGAARAAGQGGGLTFEAMTAARGGPMQQMTEAAHRMLRLGSGQGGAARQISNLAASNPAIAARIQQMQQIARAQGVRAPWFQALRGGPGRDVVNIVERAASNRGLFNALQEAGMSGIMQAPVRSGILGRTTPLNELVRRTSGVGQWSNPYAWAGASAPIALPMLSGVGSTGTGSYVGRYR